MESINVSVDEMASYDEINEIVKTLMSSTDTISGWFSHIEETATVWKLCDGPQVLGFYTLQRDGFCVEGHAYVFAAHRRKSFRFINKMIEHVKSMGCIPKTTATSDFPHVVKFLKMLGFTPVGVEKDGIIKPNGPVDVIYLLYLK